MFINPLLPIQNLSTRQKIFGSGSPATSVEASPETPSRAEIFKDLTGSTEREKESSNPNRMLTNLFIGEIIAGLALYLLSLGAGPLGRMFRRS